MIAPGGIVKGEVGRVKIETIKLNTLQALLRKIRPCKYLLDSMFVYNAVSSKQYPE